jgi:hypothetical protein
MQQRQYGMLLLRHEKQSKYLVKVVQLWSSAESVQVAATSAKDTVQDVRDTTKELRNSHVATEAATAVE